MDRDLLIFNDLKEALKSVSEKHGVCFSDFDVNIDKSYRWIKIAYTDSKESPYANLFIDNCEVLGLERSWLNKSFFNPDTKEEFKLLGLSASSTEFELVLEKSDGKRVKVNPKEFNNKIELI